MYTIIGFLLSMALASYSAYKLWQDREDHTARHRLTSEVLFFLCGLAGAAVSLVNGLNGQAHIANLTSNVDSLNYSLQNTQNYVVAAEEGRSPRSLTIEQQNRMTEVLRQEGQHAINLFWDASSVEAKRYALQVAVPFQAAGWRFAGGGNKFGVPDFPIFIGYSPADDKIRTVIANAFSAAGLRVHIESIPNLPSDTLEIDIGDKP